MCAAISAARRGHSVTVFERNEVPGKKLLMTGNGRCNITNEDCTDINRYSGSSMELAQSILSRFDLRRILDFLSSVNISTRNREGYYYPASFQASSVRDALVMEMEALGIRICCNVKLTGIRVKDEGCTLTLGREDGTMETEDFDCVILACGGRAVRSTGSDGFGYKLCKKLGIDVVKPLPALTKLYFRDEIRSLLDGVRAPGVLTLSDGEGFCISQSGQIQFLKNAVSGIAAFCLSTKGARLLAQGRSLVLTADLYPEMEEGALRSLIIDRRDRCNDDRSSSQGLISLFNDRICRVLTMIAGIGDMRFSDISDEQAGALAHIAKALDFNIVRTGDFSESQTNSGGVSCSELDTGLRFRKYPMIFAAGEMLDIAGECGGFNLHIAMASGLIAGELGEAEY